jgi:hypothetical protein
MKIFGVLFLAAFIAGTTNAQVHTHSYIDDPAATPREHSVDFLSLSLDVAFECKEGKVFGSVEHTFSPLQERVDTLFLDGPGIVISTATLNGEAVEYSTGKTGTTFYFKTPLRWNERHKLLLNYECIPKKGIYFVGWNDPKNLSRKQIWTQGQGIDNRHWIPMYDTQNDKVVSDIKVTFEKGYEVLSNGVSQKLNDNKDGTVTWHYKMSKPHPTYLIMLGIGKYDIKKEKSASGVPINLYYYPEWADRVDATYRYSVEMFDYLEKLIGVPYGWESYAQIPVQEFMFGAMENTTATIFGDFYFVDERSYQDKSYVRVNAHELAHQWFGDMVTARSSQHHWLQESFATHYDMIYQRVAFGEEHYAFKRWEAQNGALAESKKNYLPVGHSEAGTVRHYPKGATVLHMLRYVVGDDQFNATIKYYLEKHAYKNVDSEDLLIAFHENLGLSLDWFWDQWIYHGGEPHYKVGFQDATVEGKRQTQFTINQVHERNDVVGLFKMPFVFEVHYLDGTKDTQTAWIEEESHIVSIANSRNQDIAYVLFDPNGEVMKKVTFTKDFEMLKNQASRSVNMLDKYDAVVGMRSLPFKKKERALREIWDSNSFHLIRAEILNQIDNSVPGAASYIIASACSSKDRNVQLAALNTMPANATESLADYEKLLKADSYDVVYLALDKLCKLTPKSAPDYLKSTDGILGTVGLNVRVKWLEMSVAFGASQERKTMYLQELMSYVSISYEFRTRVNAAQALGRINFCGGLFLENLFDAIGSANGRLSGPCGAVLRSLCTKPTYKVMAQKALKESKVSDDLKKKIARYIN